MRHYSTAILVTCAALLNLCSAGGSARADAAQDCRSGSPDARVAGCSRLLAEARTPRQRAIALDGRCKAQADRFAYNEAIPDCSKAIRADDEYPYSFFSRGMAQAGLNNHSAAIADFTRAHNMRPNLSWVLINRGKSYALIGNTASAIRDYEEAIRLKPDNEEAKLSLAALRSGEGLSGSTIVSNSLCGANGCN